MCWELHYPEEVREVCKEDRSSRWTLWICGCSSQCLMFIQRPFMFSSSTQPLPFSHVQNPKYCPTISGWGRGCWLSCRWVRVDGRRCPRSRNPGKVAPFLTQLAQWNTGDACNGVMCLQALPKLMSCPYWPGSWRIRVMGLTSNMRIGAHQVEIGKPTSEF